MITAATLGFQDFLNTYPRDECEICNPLATLMNFETTSSTHF